MIVLGNANCVPAEIAGNAAIENLSALNYTPFHVVSLCIFILAILHTFFANAFTKMGKHIAKKHKEKLPKVSDDIVVSKSFAAEIFFFLGEVEVIFGIWVVPLLISIVSFYNWGTALNYINSRVYVEPLFVVIIMCVASTRPIVTLAEKALAAFARIFGGTRAAWWFSILTLGPLMGSFITEAGAMTISAVMLGRHFYDFKPTPRFAYATLGLLFVNISVGGLLTSFAAPPVLIISGIWNWDTTFMLTHFGWKLIVGILLCNLVYFAIFKKDFKSLSKTHTKSFIHSEKTEKIPFWITLVHVLVLVWLVLTEHHPPIFIGSFLLFLGFFQATSYHQYALNLKRPLLVGFFLAGLVIHGGLQGWWIVPLLGGLSDGALMLAGTVLTAFNDNAAVTYLSSLIPNLSLISKEAVVSGVVVGGGLTVIANAPNPAGQMLLRKYFKGVISPFYLFLSALLPTVIFFLLYYFALGH